MIDIKVYTGDYAKLRARLEVLTLNIKMDQYIRHWIEKSENVCVTFQLMVIDPMVNLRVVLPWCLNL